MKIGVTSDNHVQANKKKVGGKVQIQRMADQVMREDVAVFLNLGDMGDGAYTKGGSKPDDYDELLGTHPNTFYVFGNHDLYRNKAHKETPDLALALNQVLYPKSATLLEPAWRDEKTVRVLGDHAFVGTLGWCDFRHPGIRPTPEYHCHKDVCPVSDVDYIDLRKWPKFVAELNHAFLCRLKQAVRVPGVAHVVVAMHTPCFPTHSLENPDSLMWRYFYNYTLGQELLYLARDCPSIKFWVLAGHAHQYNRGIWGMEAVNVYTFGFKTSMDEQGLMLFDTDMDIARLREVKTMRFTQGYRRMQNAFRRTDSGQGSGDR